MYIEARLRKIGGTTASIETSVDIGQQSTHVDECTYLSLINLHVVKSVHKGKKHGDFPKFPLNGDANSASCSVFQLLLCCGILS